MGLYDFWWNTVQAGQLDDHEKDIVEIRKQLDIHRQWIEYLHKELENVKQHANIRREET